MLRPTDVHPITEFKRSTPEFVKRLRATGLPEVLTIDGRGELVVQHAAAYERLLAIVERAAARKREILTTYYPDYIPRAIDEQIRARHDIKLPRSMMEPGDPRWA